MFNIGDRVYLSDPRNIQVGQMGTVIAIDTQREYSNEFLLDGDRFAYWYPDHYLSWDPVPEYSHDRDLAHRREIGYPGSEPEPGAVQIESQQATRESVPAQPDFDRGFGIGGLSRHSADEGLDRLIANGTLRYREPTGNKMPHGQLWEPCPRCGTEPVCLDCGYCERHCTC